MEDMYYEPWNFNYKGTTFQRILEFGEKAYVIDGAGDLIRLTNSSNPEMSRIARISPVLLVNKFPIMRVRRRFRLEGEDTEGIVKSDVIERINRNPNLLEMNGVVLSPDSDERVIRYRFCRYEPSREIIVIGRLPVYDVIADSYEFRNLKWFRK